jgi:pimeloyl-ACP methyl ester carboxylesterase
VSPSWSSSIRPLFINCPGKKIPWQLWMVRDTFLGPLLVRGLNGFVRGLVTSCSVRALPPEVKAGYLEPYGTWHDRLAVLRFVQDIPLRPGDPSYQTVSDIDANLSKLISVPMMIVWGEKDFVFDLDFLAEWRRRFPRAGPVVSDAAHLLSEDAGNKIIPLIAGHLGRAVSEIIAAALKRLANEQPDATAMIHTRGIAQGNPYERRWTYRELDDESDRLHTRPYENGTYTRHAYRAYGTAIAGVLLRNVRFI